jgi:hypothetical protein
MDAPAAVGRDHARVVVYAAPVAARAARSLPIFDRLHRDAPRRKFDIVTAVDPLGRQPPRPDRVPAGDALVGIELFLVFGVERGMLDDRIEVSETLPHRASQLSLGSDSADR